MKSWKKTKRQRRRYKERNLVPLKLCLPKECVLYIREESQRRCVSMNKIIEECIKEKIRIDTDNHEIIISQVVVDIEDK